MNPFIERVQLMSVRTEAFKAEKAEAASSDLQVVHTDITLNYHVDPVQVNDVFQTIGGKEAYESKVITPAVQESLKASTARFKAEELITKRPLVQDEIANHLRQRLQPRGFVVEAVSITQFGFSEEFNRAIESKVTATQEALRAEQVLRKVKFEQEAEIVKLRAQAEGLRVQRQNVTRELIMLRFVEKWDGKAMPEVLVLGNDQALPFLPARQPKP